MNTAMVRGAIMKDNSKAISKESFLKLLCEPDVQKKLCEIFINELYKKSKEGRFVVHQRGVCTD